MRRLLAGVVLLVLMGVATAAIGHEEPASYRDEFNTVGYSGSVGTIDWKSRPWSEIGETTNPAAGKVHVDAGCKCLAIKAELLGIDSIGVRRSADLNHFESAKLYFDIDSEGLLQTISTAVVVEVTSDGTTWDAVYVYGPGDGQVSRSVSIDDWMSADFGVRFRALDLLNASVFIDNVEISGRLAHEESTTTTTTAATITITVPTTISLPTTIAVPVTTTTAASATTTTESKDVPGSPTTTEPTRPGGTLAETTTTTTLDKRTTTTTISEETAPLPSDQPPGNGPRESTRGLQMGHQSGLFGSFDDDGPEVLGVQLSAEFRTAVELIKTSWIWMLPLAGLIATFVVAGLDHRGSLEESIT